MRVLFVRDTKGTYGDWDGGAAPDHGPAFVLADGLGSRSHRVGRFVPWIETLKPFLRQQVPGAVVRSFSYSRQGRAYGAHHTNILILEDERAGARFTPYAPSTEWPVTYLAFSLGGLLFTLGLADWIRRQLDLRSYEIPNFILVQPAFVLHQDVSDTCRALDEDPAYRLDLPAPIDEFLDRTQEIQDRIVEDLQLICQHTQVDLLYWPDDHFVTYPARLLARIREIGITPTPLRPSFPPDSTDEFEKHCLVAHHDDVLRMIGAIVHGHTSS